MDAYRDLFGILNTAPDLTEGLCQQADPDIFHPEHYTDLTTHQAKAICAVCPVKEPCLAAHMDAPLGVFGGTTPQERARLGGRIRKAS